MFKRFIGIIVLCLGLFLPVLAQDGEVYIHALSYNDGIREYTGTLANAEDIVVITIFRVVKNHTIYIFVQGSDDYDPLIAIYDSRSISNPTAQPLAVDNNSGGQTNALIQFTVPDDDDYVAVIRSLDGIGDYRVVAGVNTPDVLQEAISDTTFNSEMNSAANFSCDTAARAERPILSGTTQRMETPNFVIHYTLEGEDATTPEYATVLLVALDNALRFQTQVLGWVLPPQDCGEGSDNRLDVYIIALEDGTFGYAYKDNFVGDNPNTVGRELNAAYSHLVLDNDMIFESDEISIGVEEAFLRLQSTAAHELHHNIQFGYDARDFYYGFYEGGAVWIEANLYNEPQFVGEAAQSVFDYPDVCIGAAPEDTSPPRWYGEWLMIDSIMRDFGQTAYRQIWEYLILEQGLTGFYNALVVLGSTPQDLMKRLAIRNLLQDYDLNAVFVGTVRVEATVTGIGEYTPGTTGIQPLGVDYVRVTAPPGVYTFEISGGPFELFLVGIDDATKTAQAFSLRAGGNVDTTAFTHTYVIILNTEQHIEPLDCQYTDWRLMVNDGRGFATTPPDYDVWNSSRFIIAE